VTAIEIVGLAKSYRTRRGEVRALDGLDLSVPEGGVFGFLGPNGAGKTTAIRALVGHLRASRGSVRVLGNEVPGALDRVIDRVGALVETPSFFPAFSGRRNLELLARSRGIALSQVTHAIELVGLTERADSRVVGYSLGMRQRLGVAAALLKDPELLILDEPANGLDPPGMRAMRELVRELGRSGRTVFVSSHLLGEVEQTCDRLAIVNRGRCVATGSVDEILRTATPQHVVRVPGESSPALEALRRGGFSVAADGDGALVVDVEAARAHLVTECLAGAGIYLSRLEPVERSLEDAFLELTGFAPTDDKAAGAEEVPT
jgi:ABC-2 type transport system ATP-binding protein